MRTSNRHCIAALALLFGCMGDGGAATSPSTERQIATEAEISAPVVDVPAAQIAPGSTAAACPNGAARPLASGLRIREVALYQAVKIPLVQNGTWISQRPVMVVQNKKALVRVFVDTLAGHRPRPLHGTLTLQNGADTTELVSVRSLAGRSTDEAAESTFSFEVPADQIGASTQLAVALNEAECSGASSANARDARFPASGLQALGASPTGKLKVVLVPITVGGRTPTIGSNDIEGIRTTLLAFYPVPEVEVSVRSRPLVWSGALTGTDSRAWTNIVNAVRRERSIDRPSSETYYYGVMQPAATMAAYCARGCIAGMAPQNVRVRSATQVGLSVYYGGSAAAINRAAEIIAHELGHSHGRGHAPCARGNMSGVDRGFPDPGGNIAVWGWDSRTNKLNAPSYKDVMGYCQPNWISAYTYQALAVRSQAVNVNRAFVQGPSASVRWHSLIAYADGTSRWSSLVEYGVAGGEPEPARVLDAAGNLIKNIEVGRTELSHSSDQFLDIPEPEKDWSTIVLRDREIVLSDVAAPL